MNGLDVCGSRRTCWPAVTAAAAWALAWSAAAEAVAAVAAAGTSTFVRFVSSDSQLALRRSGVL